MVAPKYVIELATLTGLRVKSHKYGKVVVATLEIPLTDELDVSGMTHNLFGGAAKVTLEAVQAVLPAEQLETPEAAG